MMIHLSSFELTDKIRKRDYSFIKRYFMEGCADKDDYSHVLDWLGYTCFDQPCNKKEFS